MYVSGVNCVAKSFFLGYKKFQKSQTGCFFITYFFFGGGGGGGGSQEILSQLSLPNSKTFWKRKRTGFPARGGGGGILR